MNNAQRATPGPARGDGGGGSAFGSKVQETSLEALTGKESCVAKGYYADRFLRLLRPPALPAAPPMSPLIRRGYFTRVTALEHVVAAFLGRVAEAALPRANIVLLGAGLDTLSFRLLEANRHRAKGTGTGTGTGAGAGAGRGDTSLDEGWGSGSSTDIDTDAGADADTTPATLAAAAAARAGSALSCFEVDLAAVALYKARCVRASPELLAAVGGERGGGEEAAPAGAAHHGRARAVFQGAGGCYALIAGDLEDTAGLEAALDAAGLDWSAPTLLVAECVLVYMPADASQGLLRWAASRFGPPHSPGAAFCSYDMILPHDAFGRVMRANLKVRGLELPGFEAWGRDLGTQLRRFVEATTPGEAQASSSTPCSGCCWDRAVGGDMNAVYQHLLTPSDRERAQRLEALDEVEEWQLLMGHYCYVTATRGGLLASLLDGVEGFSQEEQQQQQQQQQHPLQPSTAT